MTFQTNKCSYHLQNILFCKTFEEISSYLTNKSVAYWNTGPTSEQYFKQFRYLQNNFYAEEGNFWVSVTSTIGFAYDFIEYVLIL